MTVRLSGAVMTHPRRLADAQRLAGSVSPPFDVVVDPQPDGPPTGLRTAIRAWESTPGDATHRLVVEDDVVLVPGFVDHAARAAAAAQDAAIVFHANWCSRSGAAARLGALAGSRWAAPATEYTPTVALLLPATVGRGFAGYAVPHIGTWPDDVLMARYLASVGVPTYVTVPNLVEHGDLPSVAANDGHGLRLSACYDTLPDDAGWELTDVCGPAAVPLFKAGMALCAVRRPDGRWQTVDGERAMHRLGADPGRCAGALSRTLDRTAPLPRAVLTAFWQTAYLTGFVSRRPDRYPDVADQVAVWAADPLVDKALATLGPGGLCATYRATDLERLREPLLDLASTALEAGARDRTVPPARVPGRRVVLAARDETLAACLADDLTDRGYKVTTAPHPDILAEVTTETGTVVSVSGPAEPYGPGLSRTGTVPAMVTAALLRQPVVLDSGALRPLRLVHVWDLAAALDRALDAGADGRYRVDAEPLAGLDVARLVTETFAPVPVVAPDPDTPLEPESPPPTGRSLTELGAPTRYGLAEGLVTVEQWLAYEAE